MADIYINFYDNYTTNDSNSIFQQSPIGKKKEAVSNNLCSVKLE